MNNQIQTIKTEDNCKLLTGKPGELVEDLEDFSHPPTERASVKIEEAFINWSDNKILGTFETRPETEPVIETIQDQIYKDYLNNLVLLSAIKSEPHIHF